MENGEFRLLNPRKRERGKRKKEKRKKETRRKEPGKRKKKKGKWGEQKEKGKKKREKGKKEKMKKERGKRIPHDARGAVSSATAPCVSCGFRRGGGKPRRRGRPKTPPPEVGRKSENLNRK